jgi:hypothetical protein
MELSRIALNEFSAGRFTSDDVHRSICKDIVSNVKTTRASVWYFDDTKEKIISACLFDVCSNIFTSGVVLKEEDFPEYFASIMKNNFVSASDAANHPATRCFDDLYFLPNDIYSLLDFIITVRTKQIAVLCCENCGSKREWSKYDHEYLSQMAQLLRLSFIVQQREDQKFRTPGV